MGGVRNQLLCTGRQAETAAAAATTEICYPVLAILVASLPIVNMAVDTNMDPRISFAATL